MISRARSLVYCRQQSIAIWRKSLFQCTKMWMSGIMKRKNESENNNLHKCGWTPWMQRKNESECFKWKINSSGPSPPTMRMRTPARAASGTTVVCHRWQMGIRSSRLVLPRTALPRTSSNPGQNQNSSSNPGQNKTPVRILVKMKTPAPILVSLPRMATHNVPKRASSQI